MMRDDSIATDSFVLPAQTVRGSRPEMLATIDEAIVGLLALRHLIAGESLVMPDEKERRQADAAPRKIPASIAQVGRIFSELMSPTRK